MSVTLTAIGGTPPYTWAALDPLPSGLTLASDGVLSGIADTATAGAYYTVQVTDSTSATATVEVWIQVVGVAAPVPIVRTLLESGLTVVPEIATRWQFAYRNATIPDILVEIATILAPPTNLLTVIPELETTFTLGGGGGS